MTREEAVGRLVAHRDELRAQGVKSLALSGSVARYEAAQAVMWTCWSSWTGQSASLA